VALSERIRLAIGRDPALRRPIDRRADGVECELAAMGASFLPMNPLVRGHRKHRRPRHWSSLDREGASLSAVAAIVGQIFFILVGSALRRQRDRRDEECSN
jgi:hypothetical protein